MLLQSLEACFHPERIRSRFRKIRKLPPDTNVKHDNTRDARPDGGDFGMRRQESLQSAACLPKHDPCTNTTDLKADLDLDTVRDSNEAACLWGSVPRHVRERFKI